MTTTETSSNTEESSGDAEPAILIRRATPADAIPMWRVHTAAIRALSGGVYTDKEIRAWIEDDVPETYRRDMALGKVVLVGEHAGRVIAFACLAGNELEALYVHPRHAHHNVGQLLLAAVEREGFLHHARCMSLDAAMNAVEFYTGCGYRILGYCAPAFDSGQELPCVRMRKMLGLSRETRHPELVMVNN